MKKFTIIMMILLMSLLIIAGCNQEAEEPNADEQNPQTQQQTPEETPATSGESDSEYYLMIPKNSWDSVMWDRVKTPAWAWYVLIQEIGEIPIEEDGSFNISYSGELYSGDVATVTFNKFELNGKIDDMDAFISFEEGTEVGIGKIDMELHYKMDETHEVKPMFIDKTYTVNSDFSMTISKGGTLLKVVGNEPIQEQMIITYIKSEYVSQEYEEEFEDTLDYAFNDEFEVVTR